MKNKKILFYLVIICVFILIYIFNSKTLLAVDDFVYPFKFSRMPNSNTKLISNPIEIFSSMATHYKIWGGRVVSHFLLQLVFSIGINFFNFFNSIMFVLLGIMIYKFINIKDKYNIIILFFIYFMLYSLIPSPATTIMWKSGSANYLWLTVLVLGICYIYKKYYDNDNYIKCNMLNNILLFIYGLLCGCSNENVGCAVIVLEILYIIGYKKKYNKIPIWAILGLVGTIVGYLFLVLAPGNFIRVDSRYHYVKIEYIPNRILDLIIYTFSHIGEIVILVITSFIFLIIKDKKYNIIKNYYHQFVFIITSIISIFSLTISPIYPIRCLFFSFICLLIVFIYNINYINFDNIRIKCCIYILICILIVIFGIDYIKQYKYICESNRVISDEIKYIKLQKSKGVNDIIIDKIYRGNGRYNIYSELEFVCVKENIWVNSWVSKYYGINSIYALE